MHLSFPEQDLSHQHFQSNTCIFFLHLSKTFSPKLSIQGFSNTSQRAAGGHRELAGRGAGRGGAGRGSWGQIYVGVMDEVTYITRDYPDGRAAPHASQERREACEASLQRRRVEEDEE